MDITTSSLSAIAGSHGIPRFDRVALKPGILHISLGAFHRAHQAVYLDDFLNLHAENWMIVGVGLMPQDAGLIDALKSQQGLYSVLERSKDNDACRIIGSIGEVLHAPSDMEKTIGYIADAGIKIISLTITEKGYCYDEEKNLDTGNPRVAEDLLLQDHASTIYGYVLKGLQARRQRQSGPVTILSCDNLPGNGDLTRKLFMQFAAIADPSMVQWIDENLTFPNSMVDRITPVTNDAGRRLIAEKYDLADRCPVICEAYRQWIIEDAFIAGRPRLEDVGVQFVTDVEPYEKMKVRLLNGAHSALSYIAYLMGFRHVDEAMADPLLRRFIGDYMRENIVPTLSPVPGIDLVRYQEVLLERFANPAIRDQVQRLAEDGSQKIRNALIPPLLHQIASGGSFQHLVFALAAWYRYLNGVDEQGGSIEIKDPMADLLKRCAGQSPSEPTGFLQMETIFDARLLEEAHFAALLKHYLAEINRVGMRRALELFLQYGDFFKGVES